MHTKNSAHNNIVLSVLAALLVGSLIGNGFVLMSHASKNSAVHIAA